MLYLTVRPIEGHELVHDVWLEHHEDLDHTISYGTSQDGIQSINLQPTLKSNKQL